MLARVDLRSIERHFLGEGKGIQVIALEPTATFWRAVRRQTHFLRPGVSSGEIEP
jgi:hypothetical protein